MTGVQAPIPTIAWLRPEQVDLVRAAAQSAGLHIVGAGSPDATQTAGVAKAFDAEPLSDLRGAIATAQDGLVLMAAPGQFGAHGHDGGEGSRLDAEELDAAESRGVKVVSLEPVPASLVQLAEAGFKSGEQGGTPAREWCALRPLSRYTRAVIEARELIGTFGAVRAMHVESIGSSAEGSLGARLVDAMDLVELFLGEPETIHGIYTTPAAGRGVHQVPGDTVRFLQGDLSASLRLGDARAATVLASNQAGRYGLTVTLLGPGGRLQIENGRLTWTDPSGKTDEPTGRARVTPAPTDAAAVLGDQLSRLLRASEMPSTPIDFGRVLAMAQAAVLSARTGEPENPATMLKMAGA